MIGHDHVGPQFHVGETPWQFQPSGIHTLAKREEFHHVATHMAKDGLPVESANGKEIGARLRIVKARQTNGPPVAGWFALVHAPILGGSCSQRYTGAGRNREP